MCEPETTPDSTGRRESADSPRETAVGMVPQGLAVPQICVVRAEKVSPDVVGPPAVTGYDILRELGRGGMGIVYQAYDPRRQHHVALKVMQRVEPASLYRFKHEFRALADVSHPNLVTLYELVCDGRQWFFTMELVEGVDFLAHVARRGDRGGSVQRSLRRADHSRSCGASRGRTAGAGIRAALGTPGRCAAAVGGRRLRPARGRHPPPRHQADQCPRDAARPGRPARLRPGGRVGCDGRPRQPERACRRHAGLHGPGASRRGAGHAGQRLVQCRRRPLPRLDRAISLPRHHRARSWTPNNASILLLRARLAAEVPADLSDLCTALLRRRPEERPSGRDVLHLFGWRVEGGGWREKKAPFFPSTLHPPPSTRGGPFVGREPHLAALHDAFAASQKGRAVVVFVHGRSGMGKSELIQRFLHDLGRDSEVAILAGRCYERESVPFKALDSLVDALSQLLGRLPPREVDQLLPPDIAALARVFPVLRQVESVADAAWEAAEAPDRQELRGRAFAALRRLLAQLGRRRPLVLFIDDLQWGDVDSAALLNELLRPPDPPMLLLLGAYRREYAATSPCLRALLRPPSAQDVLDRRELAVEGLGPGQAAAWPWNCSVGTIPTPWLGPMRSPARRREVRTSSASWC